MSTLARTRSATLAALASIALLAAAVGPAAAADPVFAVDFPAGLACSDFTLHVEGFGGGPKAIRQFATRSGTVLDLMAGTGTALTFSNESTDRSYALSANGAVSWTATYPDGSQRIALTGHNVVILFPADGGPSTKLYVGRVAISVAATDGAWTVGATAGTVTDICAMLAS